MTDVFSEKELLQEKEILNDIKNTWHEFTEFAIAFDECFIKMSEYRSVFMIWEQGKKEIATNFIKNILGPINYQCSKLSIYKNNYVIEDYKRIIEEFNQVLTKYPFEEILANYDIDIDGYKEKVIKDIKLAKKYLNNFIEFMETHLEDILELMKIARIRPENDSEIYELGEKIAKIFKKISSDYDFKLFRELSNFIQEINALIKITTQDLINLKTAKKVCEKKQINLKNVGLLYHYTKPDFWHKFSIARFIEEGLKPSVQLGKTGTFYDNMLCFTLSCNEKYSTAGPIFFFLSPKYVTEHSKDFYYNPKNRKNSPNFLKLCDKLGFSIKPDKLRIATGFDDGTYIDLETSDEIQTLQPVPLEAIAAIVVPNRYSYRMKFFMTKLCNKHPELTVPLYNSSKELIWPL